jgi:hypothetical protein
VRSSAELAVQQANTAAFIAVDPVPLALARRTRTPNGAGGYRLGGPSLLEPQVFRLVRQPNKGETGERVLLDGTTVQVTHHLVGSADADVEEGDSFTFEDQDYEVVHVWNVGGYEVKAEVTTRA